MERIELPRINRGGSFGLPRVYTLIDRVFGAGFTSHPTTGVVADAALPTIQPEDLLPVQDEDTPAIGWNVEHSSYRRWRKPPVC